MLNRVKTQLFRTLLWLLGHLPIKLLQNLGSLLGLFLWLSRSRMWLVSRENIQRCYPQLDPHRQSLLARQSLRETGKTIAETAYAWVRQPEVVLDRIEEIEAEEVASQALAKGKGLIFVIPHLGNWEIINHYLGKHYGLTHMYQPNKNASLNQFVQTCRGKTGTLFVPTNLTGIKTQLKVLADGGCVGLMPDQEPLIHTGVFSDFFDMKALTSDLIDGYARHGAEVVIAICTRIESTGKFKLTFSRLDRNEGIDLDTMNHGIEQIVRRFPAQYLWSYKRFRTRPMGELDFYQFNHHPLRTAFANTLLSLFLHSSNRLPLKMLRAIAVCLSPLLMIKNKRKKHARINLRLCRQPLNLLRPGLTELLKTAFEVGKVWYSSTQKFSSMLSEIDDEVLKQSPHGTLILTPPLGNREVVMRFLGEHYQCGDYYHPNSHTALDKQIRRRRAAMGIRLFEYGSFGRSAIAAMLSDQQLATLSPDQQPRLRGGIFVPFFGTPALTTTAIPEALQKSKAGLAIGVARRTRSGFSVNFIPIPVDPGLDSLQLLTLVNDAIANEINQSPAQYRWSDKRFNIQPYGAAKVYR